MWIVGQKGEFASSFLAVLGRLTGADDERSGFVHGKLDTMYPPLSPRLGAISLSAMVGRLIRTAAAVMLFLLACRESAGADRFSALWSDGSRTSGPEIQDWFATDSRPRLNDRTLFDSRNPVRWIRDTTLKPEPPPTAFIEFVGGDLLPGKVVGYAAGSSIAYESLPPHVLVEPGLKIDLPGMRPRENLRVLPDMIRRVAWKTGEERRYQPGTAFLADGRRLSYRSLRWGPTGLRLLTENGPQTIALADLAEIHLPSRDPWELYAGQLAVLDPAGKSRLLRIETPDGLRATTSLERLRPRAAGDAGNPDTWQFIFQPAWTLDAMFIEHRRIALRRLLIANQAPLDWLEPVASRHRGALSSAWENFQTDANVQGGALVSNGQPFGWGFGVHAHHELEFELPDIARAFRTGLGLDQLAGSEGCARGLVYLASGRQPNTSLAQVQPVYRSDLLIGSRQVLDTGRLALEPATNAGRRLVLVADEAANDRPAGADPLDIGDIFDWLEPELELDPEGLHYPVSRAAVEQLPALEGWEFDGPYDSAWRLVNLFDPAEREQPRFMLGLLPIDGALSLTRRFTVTPGHETLVLLLGQLQVAASPSQMRVTLDGRRLAELPVPTWADGKEGPPIAIKLNGYAGRDVEVEIELVPKDARSSVCWVGTAMLEKPPEGAKHVEKDDD